jgi:hypothetical protein
MDAIVDSLGACDVILAATLRRNKYISDLRCAE